jgi:polyisoprenoid-binding protein YceI
MRLHVLPALTAACLVLPACAQIVQAAWTPPNPHASAAPAGHYTVEPAHTQVVFSVLHMGFTRFFGTFSGASGSLDFSPANAKLMSATISVPVASVATTSAKLTEELKAADWLDAARYPTMVFHTTAVTRTGPDTANVAGLLTLHGVTHPLVLHATFNGAGINMLDQKETIGFQLTGTLNRSDYGVTKYVPLIGNEITLTIAAAFEKE